MKKVISFFLVIYLILLTIITCQEPNEKKNSNDTEISSPSVKLKSNEFDDKIRINITSSVNNASYYNVYRANSEFGDYLYIGKTYELNFDDDTITGAQIYYYKATAYSKTLGESKFSNKIFGYAKIEAPDISVSTTSTEYVWISWASIPNASLYEIYYDDDNDHDNFTNLGYHLSSYYDKSILKGHSRYYCVKAISTSPTSSNESEWKIGKRTEE